MMWYTLDHELFLSELLQLSDRDKTNLCGLKPP